MHIGWWWLCSVIIMSVFWVLWIGFMDRLNSAFVLPTFFSSFCPFLSTQSPSPLEHSFCRASLVIIPLAFVWGNSLSFYCEWYLAGWSILVAGFFFSALNFHVTPFWPAKFLPKKNVFDSFIGFPLYVTVLFSCFLKFSWSLLFCHFNYLVSWCGAQWLDSYWDLCASCIWIFLFPD